MSNTSNLFYECGPFHLDAKARQLFKGEEPVAISSKVFDLLLIMVQSDGKIITKEELMDQLWPDSAVEEHNLTQNISVLRKILGETPNDHRYIVTVPGTGYQFVAPVRGVAGNKVALISEEESASQSPGYGRRSAVGQASLWRRIPVRAIQFALVLLVAGASLLWIAGISNKVASDSRIKSMAVLPFKQLDHQSCEEHLTTILADALVTRLVQDRQLRVSPISDVLRYNCSGKDLATIGRELEVDALLEGKIQQTGNRIRITVQLLRTRDGSPLWSEKFDSEIADRFEMQDSISEQIV